MNKCADCGAEINDNHIWCSDCTEKDKKLAKTAQDKQYGVLTNRGGGVTKRRK